MRIDTIPELRALVVYESMFGNTRDVARAVVAGLEFEGLTTHLVEVNQAGPADSSFDLLVVGAPTHAFSLSRRSTREDAIRQGALVGAATTGLREWLVSMKHPELGITQFAAAFDTRVTKVRHVPKSASTRAAHLLRRNGLTLVSRPVGFLVQDIAGPLVDGELERAIEWGKKLAVESQNRLTASATVR